MLTSRPTPCCFGPHWLDPSKVAALVDAAYGHYVERIGRKPGPMTEDYAEVIRNRQVTVAESYGRSRA